jgi:hypothetical protein
MSLLLCTPFEGRQKKKGRPPATLQLRVVLSPYPVGPAVAVLDEWLLAEATPAPPVTAHEPSEKNTPAAADAT